MHRYMTRQVLAFVVFVVAGLSASTSAMAAKKVALVIGNNAYTSLPVLQKAVNDANAVAASLTKIGFKVFLGTDLTRRQMNRKLADFTASIAPGDQAFLFFAGHGVALGAENYLIPSDMPKPGAGEEDLVRDEGYSVNALVSRVQRRGAAATFFVLDACRDNPFAATGVRSIGGTRGLTRVAAPTGVFVLFSAGIGQTALDRLSDNDPNPNSVFTRKLIPLLEKPGLSHVLLAKQVQQEVSALAGTVPHSQQPAYYDQIIGQVVLRPGQPAAETPEAKPKSQPAPIVENPKPPVSRAAEAWNIVKNTKRAGDLEAFIRRFPDSFFADLARPRLKELKRLAEARAKPKPPASRPKPNPKPKANPKPDPSRNIVMFQQPGGGKPKPKPRRTGKVPYVARHGLSSSAYQNAFNSYVRKGYRLSAVDGYSTPRGMRYAAIWEKKSGSAWSARHGLSANAYQSAFTKHRKQAYAPADISAGGLGRDAGNFAALWDKRRGAWAARHNLTSDQYQRVFNQYTSKKYRLVDVEGYTTKGGVVRYAALWVKRGGPAWFARHGLTGAQYQSAVDKGLAKGYRPIHVDGYWTPQGVRYAAIWEKRGGRAWAARHGLTSSAYQSEFNRLSSLGFRVVQVSGYWDGRQERYAAIWEKR